LFNHAYYLDRTLPVSALSRSNCGNKVSKLLLARNSAGEDAILTPIHIVRRKAVLHIGSVP
jgi:hypothetical protein